MYVIEVIPIARGIGKETLSYFAAENIPLGAIVEVPVRSRKLPGLVVRKRNAHEIKSEIKSASFIIKKVGKIKFSDFFLPAFIETAEKMSRYTSTTTGTALNAMTPKSILEYAQSKKAKLHVTHRQHSLEKQSLQRSDEERYDIYKSLIREEFARKSSVFILLPTALEARNLYETLKKGIENYSFLFYNAQKVKEQQAKIHQAICDTHPILIVATGPYLSLPRSDIGTYIVERESSRFYKQLSRPFIDWRRCAEFQAESGKKRLILADNLLRIETIWKTKEGELVEHEPLSFKVFDSFAPIVIDMKSPKGARVPFRVFSEELSRIIEETTFKNGRVFLFGARRGLAPSIICGDCGASVTCLSCGTGMVLHQGTGKDDRSFLCHHCGEKRPAEERCLSCGSWKLESFGIGSELIEQEVRKIAPKATVFRLDKESATTEKQAEAISKKFYSTPGAVLIGTETSLPYLSESVNCAAIVSFDSFFSIPDFRINERIMGIILKIRKLSRESSLIQSRVVDEKILEYGVRGNLLDFYKDEVKLREAYGYPPFKTLFKISFDGKKPYLISELEKIHHLFEGHAFTVFPAFIKNQKGTHTTHILFKTDSSKWPDGELAEKFRQLPLSATIKVDPDSIL